MKSSQTIPSFTPFLSQRTLRRVCLSSFRARGIALFALAAATICLEANSSPAEAQSKTRKSSIRKNPRNAVRSASNPLRDRLPLIAGGFGALALLCGAAMALGRREQKHHEPQTYTKPHNDEELIRLRTLLEFERARQKEAEDLYWKMAMNASDVLYIMHPTEGTVDWFGQIDTLLGYAQNSFPRTIEAWAESIHPEQSEQVIDMYTRSCKNAEDFRVEYRMRHRNGNYRDWQHRGRPVYDKNGNLRFFIGACSDVTERNRAQRRLRENEERLSRILETNTDAVLMCDKNGVITFANRAAELLFGTGRDSILKKTYNGGKWKITSVNGVPVDESELPFQRVLGRNEPINGVEHSIEQPSGKVIIVSVNAAPLHDESGAISGAVFSITDVTNRKALEDRLMFQAFHDPLTGLPNRALFTDRLSHALTRSARTQTSVAVFFLDLDNFKKTNDTLGHDAGDELLKATAQRILGCLRSSDTAARLGGDEFTILLENIPDESHAKIVADRVLKSLLEPVELKGQQVYAPPSIGVALSTLTCTAEELMGWADSAMYTAKKNGKSQYVFHRGEEPSVPPQEKSAVAVPLNGSVTGASLTVTTAKPVVNGNGTNGNGTYGNGTNGNGTNGNGYNGAHTNGNGTNRQKTEV